MYCKRHLPPPTSPTTWNSHSIGDSLEHSAGRVGIDRISTWTSVPEMTSTPAQWDRAGAQTTDGGSGSVSSTLFLTETVEAHLSYRITGQTARIDFNPSKGGPLAGLSETLELVEQAWDQARVLLEIPADTSEIRVSRLDLTRDFAPVDDLQNILRTASGIGVPYLKTKAFSDGSRGIETVYIGKCQSHGYLTVYDKSRQAGLPEPTLRIEAKLHKADMKQFGLTTIGELTEERLVAAYECRCTPLIEPLRIKHHRLLTEVSIKNRNKAEAVGAKFLWERGIHLEYGPARNRLHRRILALLGISSTDDIRPG